MTKKNKRKDKIIVLVTVLFISLLTVGFGTGYLQLYIAYIKCGHDPILVYPGSSFASGYGPGYYTKEDDFNYKPAWNYHYYCSEKEARQNGIKPGLFSESR